MSFAKASNHLSRKSVATSDDNKKKRKLKLVSNEPRLHIRRKQDWPFDQLCRTRFLRVSHRHGHMGKRTW